MEGERGEESTGACSTAQQRGVGGPVSSGQHCNRRASIPDRSIALYTGHPTGSPDCRPPPTVKSHSP
jgi:hypothetical protein